MEAIVVAPGVVVPAQALSFRAVRSSGPGGQNVNKVASKIELRVDLRAVEGLSPPAAARLAALAARRLDADGLLLVTSQRTRDQPRNLEDARAKVRLMVEKALHPPPPRVKTRVPRGAKERRLVQKKRQGERKAARRGGPLE